MNKIIDEKLKQLDKELAIPFPDEIADLLAMVDMKSVFLIDVEFILPDDPLQKGLPQFQFKYNLNNTTQVVSCRWFASLEEELFRRGQKVKSLDQEAARGGYRLASNMRLSDILYGASLSNSILLEIIEIRFGNLKPINKLIAQVKHFKKPISENELDCRNYLEACINGLGNSLILQLNYDNAQAYQILVGAVTFLMDRRFSISISNAIFGSTKSDTEDSN